MSARKDTFNNIVAFCKQHLNDVYGVIEGEITPKNNPRAVMAYTATFCKARITDGSVSVFSPTKIEIKWQTARRSMQRDGKETFKSEADAIKFLRENFA